MTTSILLAVALCGPAASAAPAASSPSPAPVTVPALDAKSEAALRERAQRWWDARAKRDHQAMYDLFEPAYRARVPFAEFVPESTVRARFDVSSPRVVGVTPLSDTRARVRLEFKGVLPRLGADVAVHDEDTWVKVDGQWFKVHAETIKSIITPPSPE